MIIQKIREKTDMTTKDIADYLGVSQAFISQVESGKEKLTVEQLDKLENICIFADFINTEENIPKDIDQNGVFADIGRIVGNSRFMTKMLKKKQI